MKKIEFAIIERFALGILIGFSYLPEDLETNYSELNLYIIFIVLHFKFYNNANT